MSETAQRETVAFLSAPETHGGAKVETITTHASIVFMAGDRVLKLKRAVRYSYLDFSTVELRRKSCEAELALNRRTAPQLYLAVEAVTRETDGHLALGGLGEAVDWVVVMRRFPQDALFSRLAEADRLTPDSSRYWKASSYAVRHSGGQEPESLDKEFLRLWISSRCDPYKQPIPDIPADTLVEFAGKYIALYETVTGRTFAPPPAGETVKDRIRRNLAKYIG